MKCYVQTILLQIISVIWYLVSRKMSPMPVCVYVSSISKGVFIVTYRAAHYNAGKLMQLLYQNLIFRLRSMPWIYQSLSEETFQILTAFIGRWLHGANLDRSHSSRSQTKAFAWDWYVECSYPHVWRFSTYKKFIGRMAPSFWTENKQQVPHSHTLDWKNSYWAGLVGLCYLWLKFRLAIYDVVWRSLEFTLKFIFLWKSLYLFVG